MILCSYDPFHRLAEMHAYPTMGRGTERQPVIDKGESQPDRLPPLVIKSGVGAGDIRPRRLESFATKRCAERFGANGDSIDPLTYAERPPDADVLPVKSIGKKHIFDSARHRRPTRSQS